MKISSVTLIVAFVAAAGANADVVFNQPTPTDGSKVGFGFYSHTTAKPTRSYLHADNVVLGAAADIGKVTWWGMSEGVARTDLGNFSSFTVSFHKSKLQFGSLIPRPAFASETFAIASTSPTATGRTAPTGAMEYRHEVTLTSPVTLDAGAVYFISIAAAFVDGAGDAWLWQDSDTTEHYSAVFSYASNSWSPFIDTDSAFQLSTVPGPGVGVVALGAGFIGIRRRARR